MKINNGNLDIQYGKAIKMRLISRMDVKNGKLVKTINLEGLRPLGSCKDFAMKYMNDDIDEIFLSDPVASLYGREPLFDLLDEITNDLFIPITISGGICSLSHIRKLLQIGADKIAFNTSVIKNPSLINSSAEMCGSQSIAVSIQAKKIGNEWFCFTNCGRDNSKRILNEWIKEVEERGAGEIIITSINKEGRAKGLDVELIKIINNLTNLPITYSGGFGSLDHLDIFKDKKIKISGLAISGALHYNKIAISEIRQYCSEINLKVRNL